MSDPKPSILRRAKAFFGLNRSIVSMLVMVVFIGLGEKMAERFLPLYLMALGGSAWVIGGLNSIDNALSALYSLPGGYLADRLGCKRSLLLFTGLAMIGYLIVILVPSWQAVLIGAVFFIAWTAVSLPAIIGLVTTAVDKDKRTMGVTVHSFVRRIPMALGPVIGGLLIGAFGRTDGVRLAFLAALAMGFFSLFVVQRFMADDRACAAPKRQPSLWQSFRHIRGSLVNLLVSDILIRFAEQIPYAFVVIWAVEKNGLTALEFGVLTTIEMATAMLVYIPVAYLADKYGKKPFVLITFGFFTLFPLVLGWAHTFPLFVLAFVIRGLKEFGEPTRKALIADLAPEGAKAATFGAYYFLRDLIVAAVSFSGAYFWSISPRTNFMVAFGCGLVGMVVFGIFGRDVAVNQNPNS